jgi:hypothetical protein
MFDIDYILTLNILFKKNKNFIEIHKLFLISNPFEKRKIKVYNINNKIKRILNEFSSIFYTENIENIDNNKIISLLNQVNNLLITKNITWSNIEFFLLFNILFFIKNFNSNLYKSIQIEKNIQSLFSSINVSNANLFDIFLYLTVFLYYNEHKSNALQNVNISNKTIITCLTQEHRHYIYLIYQSYSTFSSKKIKSIHRICNFFLNKKYNLVLNFLEDEKTKITHIIDIDYINNNLPNSLLFKEKLMKDLKRIIQNKKFEDKISIEAINSFTPPNIKMSECLINNFLNIDLYLQYIENLHFEYKLTNLKELNPLFKKQILDNNVLLLNNNNNRERTPTGYDIIVSTLIKNNYRLKQVLFINEISICFKNTPYSIIYNDLNSYLNGNKHSELFSNNYRYILQNTIYAMNGDFYGFLNIIPIIEYFFRKLILSHEGTTNTFKQKDNVYHELAISTLINNKKDILEKIFNERGMEYLRLLFSTETLNIRNEYCHGLLDYNTTNNSIYFLYIYCIQLFFTNTLFH